MPGVNISVGWMGDQQVRGLILVTLVDGEGWRIVARSSVGLVTENDLAGCIYGVIINTVGVSISPNAALRGNSQVSWHGRFNVCSNPVLNS